jgi:hypothetical protein
LKTISAVAERQIHFPEAIGTDFDRVRYARHGTQ